MLSELVYGTYKRQRVQENLARPDTLPFEIVALSEEDAVRAGRIRAALERQGTPIGPYDLLIAAQAITRELTLVSANSGEFEREPDLRLEN